VIDLVSVLQQSLEKTGGARKKTKARAKHAHHEKKAA
jgi:non-homologous end joining protein Ku